MGHSHHQHQGNRSEKDIKVAFFLNLLFSIIEIIGGLWTNSIAILSDALHDLGDSFTLGVSWYFARLSKRGRDQTFSYGYKRFSVLGAIISSIILTTGSVFIISEAIPRLWNPVQPDTQGMILLAVVGVIVNGIAAFRLSKNEGINERAVYLHLLEDVLGWVATLIGAIIMHFFDAPFIDPTLSVLISIFILYNVGKNIKESFRIILQGTPSNIDLETIQGALKSFPHVIDAHDCHAWSLDGSYHILSVHLVMDENQPLEQLASLKNDIKSKLEGLGINHATIEFETVDENCEPC